MDFELVLIGSDINTYYMARSFHEAYNRKCYMIGTKLTSATLNSNIFTFIQEPKLNDKDTFVKTLTSFAKQHEDKKLVLIGTNDVFVRLIIENAKVLKKYYLFNYCSEEIMNNLMNKELFYTVYQNKGLSFAKTFIYSKNNKKIPKDFTYPVILKPSNTVKYFSNIILGLPKIFKPKSYEELLDNIKMIEETDYQDSLIIQEFIPGDDSALFDSVFYLNKNSKAQFASFAQIGLQEHHKNAIGNATVMINGYNEHGSSDQIILELKEFLEKINFKGLCEVDLKYDCRDNTYKVLEINVRQGRSSYYLTALGYNLVKAVIDDLIYNQKNDFIFIKDKLALSFVPKYVIKKYVFNINLKKEMLKLYRQNKVVDPLFYKKDLNPKRIAKLLWRKINYIKKYKNSEW